MTTKIGRVKQKVFAASANNNGQLGSLQLGTRIDSNDLTVLQALGAFDTGYNAMVVGGQKVPALEELQSLSYIATYQLAYLFQEGIPEYDATTNYYTKSIVKKPNTYEIWGSKIDDNLGNAVVAGTNWQFLQDLSNPSAGVLWCGTATGSANALVLTPAKPLTAYAAGVPIAFIVASDNTSQTVTANVSSLGTRPITKNGSTLLALRDLPAGKLLFLIDNGTSYELVNYPAFSRGADIASASTINLDAAVGNIIDITGAVTIATMTLANGGFRVLRFQNALMLTNSGNLVLPTGADIKTAAGDYALAVGYASGVVRLMYFRADGTALIGPKLNVYSDIASGTFTTTANITAATAFEVELVGAGAGASGNANATSGNGAGAGATVRHLFTGLAPNTAYNYTIGTKGIGGSAGQNAGTSGNNSTLTWNATTLVAGGGNPGPAGIPGIGGLGGTASGGNIANIPGGDGGGGSGANNVVPGGNGGGSSQGGGPGGIQAYSSTVKGPNARVRGCGGAASANNANAASPGGDGMDGQITIRWVA